MRKLPYIPDKRMYAAVMGCCRWMRENGYYFNKATEYFADKYDVDLEDLQAYIRMAQGNGQREAAKNNPRKYKYYVCLVALDYMGWLSYDDNWYESWDWHTKKDWEGHVKVVVQKATSAKNARTKIEAHSDYIYNHSSGPALWVIWCGEFSTKKEAEEFAEGFNYDKQWEKIREECKNKCW